MWSIVDYFLQVTLYFWRTRRASQNTRHEWKYTMILNTKPSNKRFIIQIEGYKIELSKYARLSLLQVKISRAFIATLLVIGQKWNLVNQSIGFSSALRGSMLQRFANFCCTFPTRLPASPFYSGFWNYRKFKSCKINQRSMRNIEIYLQNWHAALWNI